MSSVLRCVCVCVWQWVMPDSGRSSISRLEACCADVLPPSVNTDVKVSSSSGVCASAAATCRCRMSAGTLQSRLRLSLNVQRFKGTFLDDRCVQHVQHSPAFCFSTADGVWLLLPRSRCNLSHVDSLTLLAEAVRYFETVETASRWTWRHISEDPNPLNQRTRCTRLSSRTIVETWNN
jgi:hypothetical protein